MTADHAHRRLAAILVADVVGYSRMMETDEAGTLDALKLRRATVLTPRVAQHRGRVVKLLGDGALVEFGSAVDAMQCAIALQAGFAAANEGVSETLRVLLRIGINLGDIIIEGSDIYGECVNVAARLEAFAEPGGIVVSGTVHEHISGKLKLEFDDLGATSLKNIDKPVRIFRLATQGRTPEPVAIHPGWRTSSIAILPFAYIGNDPAQSYFSEGFTKDLITELSRWRHLSVKSSSASIRNRGLALDTPQASTELHVRFIVEGSIRRIGARVRISAQLIDGETGSHVWAEKFDRDAEDLFAVQDQVVQIIVSTVVAIILGTEAERSRQKPTADLAAYECVMKGNALPWADPDGAAEATRLFAKAIQIDPNYGYAHAMLATMLLDKWDATAIRSDALLQEALALAKRGAELDPHESATLSALSRVYMKRRSFDQAFHFMRRAIDVNPNNQWSIADMGTTLTMLGQAEEGLIWLKRAKDIDSNFEPTWYWLCLGLAYLGLGRYQEALNMLENSSANDHRYAALKSACLARLGEMTRARSFAADCLIAKPDFSIRHYMETQPYKDPADAARLAESLGLAGLPE